MKLAGWITTTQAYAETLPRLKFPLSVGLPDLFVPQSTALEITGFGIAHTYLWCYLERRVHGRRYQFNPESLSAQRARDVPRALERLSKQQRFENHRPRSVASQLASLSNFLNWLDDSIHKGKFESVLSDPDIALAALQSHHTHLRQRVQGHGGRKHITKPAAALLDRSAIKAMSTIHGRVYGDEIEALTIERGQGVRAPKTQEVETFMACVQGVFDSVVRLTLESRRDTPQDSFRLGAMISGQLTWNGDAEEHRALIRNLDTGRLLDVGCMAYAAVCLGDSGANLAQIQAYEAPDSLDDLLGEPERLTLKQKVIKFRAGGKSVPVHLTATSFTRLSSYLQLRSALLHLLGCEDIQPMLIQGEYKQGQWKKKVPIGIKPIAKEFTSDLRARFRSLGIDLPSVTMQQLRVYRQGDLARKHNPRVVADMTGNTIETAIRAYNKLAEADARAEMAPFLANLTRVVRSRSDQRPTTRTPVGACDDHGNPKPIADDTLVVPDCKKAQGCFFCDKYSLHADEQDATKLASCRAVLERLRPVQGSGSAERVYALVLDRVTSLLNEIQRINPEAHHRAEQQVVEAGNLTRYWASKLQQLHLLGLLGSKHSHNQFQGGAG